MFGSVAARRCAAAVLAGAVGLAACGGTTGLLKRSDSKARSSGGLPGTSVDVRLADAHVAELLARQGVPVRLRSGSAGGVRVRALLESGSGRRTGLGPTHTATLAAGRWREVVVPLGDGGRAALLRCPKGRVVVKVGGGASARSREAPLRLDPPPCKRFFASSTFWNSRLAAGAPLDRDSRAVTDQLLRQVRRGMRSNKPPTINTHVSAPPVVTVGASQAKVRVHLDRPPTYAPRLAKAFAAVPLPAGARPSDGSDSELIVWQPATDTLWEFWLLKRGLDGWHAKWGGRLRHVSTGPALFTEPHEAWGVSASGLPLVGGLITPRELRRGEIDHALTLGIPMPRAKVFARPASRTDGFSNCLHAVPEGARFRLDPDLDIDGLDLPRPVRAMARAAQRYGIFVRDRSGAVSFYAQNANTFPRDPYPALFEGRTAQQLVARFPWSHLHLVRMQLGREEGGGIPPPQGFLSGCL